MHSFALKAPYATDILSEPTLKRYVHNAAIAAKTKEAIEVYEIDSYKDFDELNGDGFKSAWSPKYFGYAIEFLAEHFFEVFGSKFNIGNVVSGNDYENVISDGGVDHYGISLAEQKIGYRKCRAGDTVFIQTKGVLNPRYEFTTNDGARLPNFFMNAQAQALRIGQSYRARYVLFTTGSGIHYALDNNSGNLAEVINYKKISQLVDNNIVFWNGMRKKMGLEPLKDLDDKDPDWQPLEV